MSADYVAGFRSDNSLELWDVSCALSQSGAPVCQARLPPAGGAGVEALAWSGGRLFSTGLHGHVLEHGGHGLEATASTSMTGDAAWPPERRTARWCCTPSPSRDSCSTADSPNRSAAGRERKRQFTHLGL